MCTPQDACHVAGTCQPGTGTCTNPPAPDGATCDDGNPCTEVDVCRTGACVGTEPITIDRLIAVLSQAPEVTGCSSGRDGKLVHIVTKGIKQARLKTEAARRNQAKAHKLTGAARKAMTPAEKALAKPGKSSPACVATLKAVVGSVLDRLGCLQ